MIIRKNWNEGPGFEYCDEKNVLQYSYKVKGEDNPVTKTKTYGQIDYLSGSYSYKYRDITFQIIPFSQGIHVKF